eukprot:scaffold23625_cov20-Prasinocladus_malaysianus.AAC.1
MHRHGQSPADRRRRRGPREPDAGPGPAVRRPQPRGAASQLQHPVAVITSIFDFNIYRPILSFNL